MNPIRPWHCLGVTGMLLALSAGCNHAQRQHTLETPCETGGCGVSTTPVQVVPAPAAPLPVAPATPVAPAAPQPLPAQVLPPVAVNPIATESSTSAKITDPMGDREEIVKRRHYGDITADPRFAHAADYTWLVGKLNYVHGKDQWRLRFTSVDEEDRVGGSVTLQGISHRAAHLKDGLLVRVEGQLIDPESRGVAPAYRVNAIAPVE